MNLTNICFGVLTVSSLVVPVLSGSLNEWGQIRELKSQQSAINELAGVADTRYRSGCLLLSAGTYPRLKFPSLQLGMIPKNRETNQPLPKGTVVCDVQGATGVVSSSGAINHIAVTPNRDVVAARLKRFRGGLYSQPVMGGI